MTIHEWHTYHQCTLWRFCRLLLIKKPSQCMLPKQLSTCFHWVFTIGGLRARTTPWFFGHFWKCSEVVDNYFWRLSKMAEKSRGRSCSEPFNYFRLFENHLTLFKDSRVFLSGLLSLMGTSDMNSTPPAITVSHWPLAISPTAFRIKKRKKEIALWETQPLKKLWRSIATINYFTTLQLKIKLTVFPRIKTMLP